MLVIPNSTHDLNRYAGFDSEVQKYPGTCQMVVVWLASIESAATLSVTAVSGLFYRSTAAQTRK